MSLPLMFKLYRMAEASSEKDQREGPHKAYPGKGPSQADEGECASHVVSTEEEESDTEIIIQSLSVKDL